MTCQAEWDYKRALSRSQVSASRKGNGKMNGCVLSSVDQLVGVFVVSKIPASLSGGTVNKRVNTGL